MSEEQRAEYVLSIRRYRDDTLCANENVVQHAIVSLPAPVHECDIEHVWAEVQGAAKALMDGAAREKL